eukprot:jgi/Galph1/3713/GphlegSOOS_G2377.1
MTISTFQVLKTLTNYMKALCWTMKLTFQQLCVETESPNYRLTTCFAPHFFGSGKTTFCRNYLKLLQEMNEKALEDYRKVESTEYFLEKLKKSAFLYVDLQKLNQCYQQMKKETLNGHSTL